MTQELYDQAWQALIKSEGSSYEKLLLSYPTFDLKEKYSRYDFTTRSSEGFKIQATFYYKESTLKSPQSVVTYMHTKGGNRFEGLYLTELFNCKLSLLVFDFVGCGFSEGEYITLGVKEANDTELVINELERKYSKSKY